MLQGIKINTKLNCKRHINVVKYCLIRHHWLTMQADYILPYQLQTKHNTLQAIEINIQLGLIKMPISKERFFTNLVLFISASEKETSLSSDNSNV